MVKGQAFLSPLILPTSKKKRIPIVGHLVIFSFTVDSCVIPVYLLCAINKGEFNFSISTSAMLVLNQRDNSLR